MRSKWFGRMVAGAALALGPVARTADRAAARASSPAVVKIGAARRRKLCPARACS